MKEVEDYVFYYLLYVFLLFCYMFVLLYRQAINELVSSLVR